jgi:hypothetical protein
VLTGTSLSSTISIDSVRGTNPCFALPSPSRELRVPVVPYGCDLSTIQRPLSPTIRIRERGEDYVVVETLGSRQDVTLWAVDVLGRSLSTQYVPAGSETSMSLLTVPANGVVFIHAVNASGATSIPVAGAR